MRGEHVGVYGAERRAVGVADVVQLLLSQCPADPVHVARDIVRAQVRQDVAVLCFAAVGEVLRDLLGLLPLGVRVGVRVRGHQRLQVVVAQDRRTLADAPRVERHDVELVADLAGEHSPPDADEVVSGSARPTRVRHQHANALVRFACLNPDERELDGLAVGTPVVERYVEARALNAAAAPPIDRRRGLGGRFRAGRTGKAGKGDRKK